MQYVTQRTCYFNGHVFKQGEILDFTGKGKPPHHFTPVQPENIEEKQAEVAKEMSEKEAICAEMDEMGKAYDKRWSLKKMKEALIIAKKETGK